MLCPSSDTKPSLKRDSDPQLSLCILSLCDSGALSEFETCHHRPFPCTASPMRTYMVGMSRIHMHVGHGEVEVTLHSPLFLPSSFLFLPTCIMTKRLHHHPSQHTAPPPHTHQGSRVRAIWSHMRPKFVRVRLKCPRSHRCT